MLFSLAWYTFDFSQCLYFFAYGFNMLFCYYSRNVLFVKFAFNSNKEMFLLIEMFVLSVDQSCCGFSLSLSLAYCFNC